LIFAVYICFKNM